MAELVVGSYLFRYPLGGMASWVLQYLEGFVRLGHRVTFVERADHADACFDPVAGTMGDDPTTAIALLLPYLRRVGLGDRWCMVTMDGVHHGLGERALRDAFIRADAFLDMGTHGAFGELATSSGMRVLLDGEPGFTQVRMERARRAGSAPSDYDRYVTTGAHVGTPGCPVPEAGVTWEHCFHPVVTSRYRAAIAPVAAPFTTVMNWRSHREVELDGVVYGQKDRSFTEFETLPSRVDVPMELAVAGLDPPVASRLRDLGWRLRDGHGVTASVGSFEEYVTASAGEIGICKDAFVTQRTGWFSDRSALFLAMGRPVVVQDTGLADVLPCGEGLVAVADVHEATLAIESIAAEPKRHRDAARQIAEEHLDVGVVLPRLLESLGLG